MTDSTPQFLTVRDLAELCNVSTGTVHGWRHRNVGPPAYKIAGALRFRLDEVLAYIESCKQTRDAEAMAAAR